MQVAHMLVQALAAVGALTLVEDGRPLSVIVTGNAPGAVQTQAAAELQEHLKLMTDAVVPVVKEGELAAESRGVLILVGQSKRLSSLGVDTTQLEPETFLVRTRGDALILAGDDGRTGKHERRGTMWAVVDFLQDQLGCRWIWPGETGRVVPKRKTVTVGDLAVQETPLIKRRHLRAALQDRHKAMYEKAKLGRWFDLGRTYAQLGRDESQWMLRMRFGSSFPMKYGHAFTSWWKRCKDTHPDVFALQPDGRRGPRKPRRPDFVKMCVSNPKLWDLQLARFRSQVRKGSGDLFLNACENDGSGGFCTCKRCRAWDAPAGRGSGRRSSTPDGSDVDGGRDRRSPLPDCLSDRYARWYNELARRVRQVHPDGKVIAYAYGRYADPPVAVKRIEPNVWIGYIGFNFYPARRDESKRWGRGWKGWSERGATVFLRSNALYFSGEGAPYVFADALAKDFKWQVKRGLRATDFDCQQGHWAVDGPTTYVLARLLWDTGADPAALETEYYEAFGPMADAVRAYFDYWEAFTTKLADHRLFADRKRVDKFKAYPRLYTQNVFGRAHALLAKARAQAGRATLEERERLGNLKLGLEHAERMVAAIASGDMARTRAARDLLAFRRRIASRNVLNVYFKTWKEVSYRMLK